MTLSGVLPEPGTDASPFGLSLGSAFDAAISNGGTTAAFTGETPDGPVAVSMSTASGETRLAMDEASFDYEASARDLAVSVTPPGIPLPFAGRLSETTTRLSMPVAPTGEAEPYALDVVLRDLSVDDAIWSLFDPTAQLPRDPATLVLSMSGEAEVTVDVFGDPEAMMAMTGSPVEPRSLDLTEVLLRFAGAEVTARGALRFPPGADVPIPAGDVAVTMTGALALADKLVAMGIVPPQQAAFVKGAVSGIARQVGPDELEVDLTLTEQGGILANGVPLQ